MKSLHFHSIPTLMESDSHPSKSLLWLLWFTHPLVGHRGLVLDQKSLPDSDSTQSADSAILPSSTQSLSRTTGAWGTGSTLTHSSFSSGGSYCLTWPISAASGQGSQEEINTPHTARPPRSCRKSTSCRFPCGGCISSQLHFEPISIVNQFWTLFFT